MPLATYTDLKTSILHWLARPGDPLVEPAVPDMIRLFEVEANRRLKQADAEQVAFLEATGGVVELPAGCTEVRLVLLGDGGPVLQYLPPAQMPHTFGVPYYYTIQNHFIAVGPVPETISLAVVYQAGLVPLSDSQLSNWLLASAPDAYLFGVLVEAEAFIGHDERAVSWLQRREAAFAGLEAADRKLRWPGGLQIRADGITTSSGGGGGGGGGVPLPPEAEVEGPVIVVSPLSATAVYMEDDWRSLYVASAPDTLTIVLPRNEVMSPGEIVQVNFSAPVADFRFVEIPEGGGGAGNLLPNTPTTAYGPGAAIVMRWVGTGGVGWVVWK